MLILAQIRYQHRLSSRFVSQLAGIDVDQYEAYENDLSGHSLKQHPELIKKLTKILGVEPEDLFQTLSHSKEAEQIMQQNSVKLSTPDKNALCDLLAYRDQL